MLRPPVIHFNENKSGRDFVVGDIHGCYSVLRELLNFVDFRPATDRLFSVGDLIDRGPSSLEVLDLLHKPWFFAVRGNHEQMLIEHLKNPQLNPPHDNVWLNKVYRSITDRQRFAGKYIPLLEHLPFVISVGEGLNKFFVVHAEILEEKQSVDEEMIEQWSFKDPGKAKRRALWGRSLYQAYQMGRPVKRAHIDRLPLIYCGHTIMERPIQLARQVFLDGGAYLSFDVDAVSKMKDKSSDFRPSLRMVNVNDNTCYSIDCFDGSVVKTPIIKVNTL